MGRLGSPNRRVEALGNVLASAEPPEKNRIVLRHGLLDHFCGKAWFGGWLGVGWEGWNCYGGLVLLRSCSLLFFGGLVLGIWLCVS